MQRIRFVSSVAVVALLLSAGAFAQEKGGESKGKAAIGQPAPDFSLVDITGKTHKLSDYKDKIVVLEWINRQCPYSVKAAPLMKKTADEYLKKGIVWLAIDSSSYATAKDNEQYTKDKQLPYPILMDTDGAVGHLFGARTTPHIFIINKGTLAYMGAHDNGNQGGEGSRNYVAESLEALLAGKAVPVAETKSYGCSVKYKG